MKFRSILAAALAVLTLAACSKSGDKEIDGGEIPESGEAAYTTFTVSIAKANEPTSRAFHGDTTPTASEGSVVDLTLYIYDVATSTIEEVITFNPPQMTKTALITTGPKIFAATSGIATTEAPFGKGETVTNFENYIVNIADAAEFSSTLTKTNSFWMASELVSQTVVSATENESKTNGHPNNITIKLGRSVAKIGVYYNPAIDVTNGDDVTDVLGKMSTVKYRIKNQPDQLYLFTTMDSFYGVWRTPYYNRNNSVWSDLHANNYWAGSWHTTGIDGSSNHEDPTYMMENSNLTARYGNATYAAIQGVFTPAKWYDTNGTLDPTTANPGDDFWRVATAVEFEADGTTVKEVISWAADNKLYSAVPLTGVGEYAIKYEGGVMYYWIYLDSSLGNTPPATTADKYSQHRNQYWDVEITKVSNLGWNTEDGGKPDNPNPLDPDSYIQVTIQVLNWEGVYMPGEL